jgi:cell fate regulator YaaT (PSP1 superfamily)
MTLYQVQIDCQSRTVYASWEGASLKRQTQCIVQTEAGETYGQVLESRDFISPITGSGQVLRLLRLAGEEDHKKRQKHRQVEKEAFLCCRDQARALGLQMKLVQAHLYFDEGRLLFIYTSDSRVDFRELVRGLAHRFHVRIEMRQVGVRDEARLLGGYGHCGRPLCCSSYLQQFYPITIRMAKDQGLSLNPAKISGRCGRLMCCLRYECPSKKGCQPHGQPSE